jgi:cytoskeleton protein RodZ
MIDQYIHFYSEADPPISSISKTTSELSAADPRIKWTTYIVVLIIGVLLAAWWWNKEQNEDAPISLDSQSPSLEEPARSDDAVVSSEIEAVSEELIEAGETGAASTSQTASVIAAEVEQPAAAAAVSEPSVAEAEVVETGVVETERQAVAAEVGGARVVEVGVVEVEMESPETAQVAPDETFRIAASGSDKLKIVVHADTWADIKDATSYQLAYDLLRADNTLELTGQAPFTVFLGNGHGVEIIFNGEEIDVAPRVRDDNTARFKIGG